MKHIFYQKTPKKPKTRPSCGLYFSRDGFSFCVGAAERGDRVNVTSITGPHNNADIRICPLVHILSINSEEANKQPKKQSIIFCKIACIDRKNHPTAPCAAFLGSVLLFLFNELANKLQKSILSAGYLLIPYFLQQVLRLMNQGDGKGC